MQRIIAHNSAQSQLNLHPHNSPHNWTKLTCKAAYFGEMEMRQNNTWLFSEVATRCLHQITSDRAIIDRKRGKFIQKFQFSIVITIHHFDVILSNFTDSELEIVNPSPVKAHTNSSFAEKTKEKWKRGHSSSINAETPAKQPQNADFYAEKGKLVCKFCSIWMDYSRQSVLSAHFIGDTHKKQKERAAQTGQIQGSLITTFTCWTYLHLFTTGPVSWQGVPWFGNNSTTYVSVL